MRILFITGAGISAESGIPTYRDNPGEESRISSLSITNDYTSIWSTIKQWYPTIKNSQPNSAHQAIYDLSKSHKVMVATQNIDGLHNYPTSNNYQVIELHGNIQEMCCLLCQKIQLCNIENQSCIHCANDCRPNIVLYGGCVDENKGHAINRFAKYVDFVVIIGTTMTFEYLNYFILKAKHGGAKVININPNMDYKYATQNIKQTATQGLQTFIQTYL